MSVATAEDELKALQRGLAKARARKTGHTAKVPDGCTLSGTNKVQGQCDYKSCNYPFCVEME